MNVRRIVYMFFSLGLFTAAALLGACFFLFQNHSIDFSRLEQYNPGRPSIVLDDEGHELARFQLDRREPITLEQMPEHLIHAFLAGEDWYFFEHCGISWRGVLRSILVNVCRGRRAQGASTITQQLVRLLFFDAGKTFTRKVKEQFCALLIEQQFSIKVLETILAHILQ